MTQIEIGVLVADRDWPAVCRLWAECGWRDPGIAVHPSVCSIVARDTTRDVLVGVVVYRVERPPLAAQWHDKYGAASRVALLDIAVAPGSRRHGTGTRLVQAVARVALAAQIPFVWAWPSLSGAPSQRAAQLRFFQTCGLTADTDMHPGHVNLVGQSATMADQTRCRPPPPCGWGSTALNALSGFDSRGSRAEHDRGHTQQQQRGQQPRPEYQCGGRGGRCPGVTAGGCGHDAARPFTFYRDHPPARAGRASDRPPDGRPTI